MAYMFDSIIFYYIIRGRPTIVKEYLNRSLRAGDEILLSTIVVSELRYAAQKTGSKHLLEVINSLVNRFRVVPYDMRAQREYIRLIKVLKSRKRKTDRVDLQIVAHSISVGAILVTGNVMRYDRIEGLKIEDWTM
jgi:tRNA(fMet)-specific endonuclease VapC